MHRKALRTKGAFFPCAGFPDTTIDELVAARRIQISDEIGGLDVLTVHPDSERS
jgi:hypothetical protein